MFAMNHNWYSGNIKPIVVFNTTYFISEECQSDLQSAYTWDIG